MMVSTYISKEEEASLGVTEEKTDEYRGSVNAPASDNLAELRAQQAQSEEAAKRARSDSASVSHQRGQKKQKKSKM
jgi:hypothetical protein